jgi:hypothetical protein
MIPFTVDQFLNVFARYNAAVWPAQIGMKEDFGLVIAAVSGFLLILLQNQWKRVSTRSIGIAMQNAPTRLSNASRT